MKRLVFLGSIVGTITAFLVACLAILATLVWLLRVWYPAPWVIGLVGVAMLVAAIGALWRWWRLPAERRFRFSLRGMLVGLTLFALWLGTVGVNLLHLRQEISAIAEMASCGVSIRQEPIDADLDWARTRRLERLLGYNPCVKVSWIEIRSDQGLPALLEHTHLFPDLEYLGFETSRVTDSGLERSAELRRYPKLRELGLRCNITDSGLERLADWKALEELYLFNCGRITDAGLVHLQDLPNLHLLWLLQENGGKTPVTDAGMAHVARLGQLDQLVIVRLPITDAGLAHLRDMPNLEHVCLHWTAVTNPGIQTLCRQLPDCLVTWDEASFPAVCQTRQIEVWETEPEMSLLSTITDADRIAAIKTWLDQDRKQHRSDGRVWSAGFGGTCLSLRFEGQRRRLTEVGLGNGVYADEWNHYCRILPVHEQQIRDLLGVDLADWNTRQPARGGETQGGDNAKPRCRPQIGQIIRVLRGIPAPRLALFSVERVAPMILRNEPPIFIGVFAKSSVLRQLAGGVNR